MPPFIHAALAAGAALPGWVMQPYHLLMAQLLLALAQIALVWMLVRTMNLGGDVRLDGEDHVRALAQEALCGFEAVDIALDRARIGALVRDGAGRVLVIRRHGSHFVARMLTSYAGVRLDRQFITIATGDRHFGAVTLNLGDQAQIWAASLRRLGRAA